MGICGFEHFLILLPLFFVLWYFEGCEFCSEKLCFGSFLLVLAARYFWVGAFSDSFALFASNENLKVLTFSMRN